MQSVKIFVLGAGALPEEGKMTNAGGLRTAQFLEKIISTKGVSRVEVLTIESILNNEKKPKIKKMGTVEVRQIEMTKDDVRLFRKAKKVIADFSPDAVFGINVFPSFVAAKCISKEIPFWADLNGWIVAERQIQAVASGNDNFIADAWNKEREILLRADRISVVSTPQKYATLGEMAALGLLNRDNVETHVEVVENACRPLAEAEKKKSKNLFRGQVFPQDAFALLWIGGMNAWADEKTLFEGVENAMRKNEKIHFVMTGGVLAGIDEKQFPSFCKKAKKSPFRERFHFLGWREADEMPALFRECNVGINVDQKCPETEIGARNRLNEFLRFGLPVISTRGSEIAEKIAKKGAGIEIESSDPEKLAMAIEQVAFGGDFLEKMRYNGGKLVKDDFSIEKTTAPIEKFLKDPKRMQKIPISGNAFIAGLHYLRERGAKAFLKKCRQKISETIGL